MAVTKDTIYIDSEEEITGIIDKIQSAESKLVALVLPKKTSVLQSSVNMKLMKRSADLAEKNLVLITSDESLKTLAANNNIYVASDLNSKPTIPPVLPNVASELKDETTQGLQNSTIDLNQYQSAANLPTDQKLDQIASSIPVEGPEEFDAENQVNDPNVVDLSKNEDELVDNQTSTRRASNPTNQNEEVLDSLTDKKIKAPRFSRFKILILAIIGFVILLLLLTYYVLAILPKADIKIKTDALNIKVNTPINLDNFKSSSSASSGVLYTKTVNYSKNISASVPTSGSVNNGQTASGQVTIGLTNCNNTTVNIPAGTSLSYNNLTYTTQSSLSLSAPYQNGQCQSSTSGQTVNVTALNNGSSYNLASGQTMQMSTFNGYSSSDFTVVSDGISGGTDNIQKVVAQADITSVDSKLKLSSSTSAINALEQQLQADGFDPIKSSFVTSKPQIAYSAQLNQPAATLTATEKVTYTMTGVDSSELQSFLNKIIQSKIKNSTQTILNNGYNSLVFSSGSSPTNYNLNTTAEVGPKLSVSQVQLLAAGHSSSYVVSQLKKNPNIQHVTITVTPSWLGSLPSNKNKIIVNILKP